MRHHDGESLWAKGSLFCQDPQIAAKQLRRSSNFLLHARCPCRNVACRFPYDALPCPARRESRAIRLCPSFTARMLPVSRPRQTVWCKTRSAASTSPARHVSPSPPPSRALATTGSGRSTCRVVNPPALDRTTHQTALRSLFPTRFRLPSVPPISALGSYTVAINAIARRPRRGTLLARLLAVCCCISSDDAAFTSCGSHRVMVSASLRSANQIFQVLRPWSAAKVPLFCAARLSTEPGTAGGSQINQAKRHCARLQLPRRLTRPRGALEAHLRISASPWRRVHVGNRAVAKRSVEEHAGASLQPVRVTTGRLVLPGHKRLAPQHEARLELAVASLPPGNPTQRPLAHPDDQLARRHGPMILAPPQQLRRPAHPASRLRRQRRTARPPHAHAALHTDHVLQPHLGQPLAKPCVGAVAGIGQHHPPATSPRPALGEFDPARSRAWSETSPPRAHRLSCSAPGPQPIPAPGTTARPPAG